MPETEALYYDDPFKTESKGKVLKIIGSNVVLDKTVAYPTSGGQLHDIGKIGVPDAVLLKPGKLDDREYAAIKQHAIHTKEILHKMHWPKEWSDIPLIAAMHHERLDGSGYPERHHGLEMPTIARILAIADTYDALVAIDRPYRRASSHAKVIEYLDQEVKKGLYDKKVYLTLKNIELLRLQPIYGDRIYSRES